MSLDDPSLPSEQSPAASPSPPRAKRPPSSVDSLASARGAEGGIKVGQIVALDAWPRGLGRVCGQRVITVLEAS
jgi:hypothetical protein